MTANSDLGRFLAARDFLLAHRQDYDTAYRDFRWPELHEFNWALDYFDGLARDNQRDALCVVDEDGGETRVSFAAMAERSNQTANFLRGLGVQRGEAILLMLGNVVPLWELMLAAMKLGAVIIPATILLTEEDLRDRVARGGVRHVVTGPQEAAKFVFLPAEITRILVGGAREGWHSYADYRQQPTRFVADGVTRPQDPLLLYFTSGTTAKPKLVVHNHQSYPVGHLSTMYWIGLQPGDLHLNISSPGWAKHAWSSLLAPWNAGATIFIVNSARFHAGKMIEIIARFGVTSLCAPPTVWRLLIQEDLAAVKVGLREAVSAGEPLNPEVIDQVKKAWGIIIRDGYGQTETSCQIGNSPGQTVRPGSMGRPLPGYRIALLDAEDRPAAEGELSISLAQRPVALMDGYRDNPEKTAELMRDGYYRCGDIAAISEDGYLTYVGRADDVFKASDYRISPFELESVLIEHEAVAEAAVVPSPDPLRLSVPKAFIQLRAGFTASDALALSIFRHCRQRIAPFKRIRIIEVAELPKTISGKIRRVDLKRLEAERRARSERGELEWYEEEFRELTAKD